MNFAMGQSCSAECFPMTPEAGGRLSARGRPTPLVEAHRGAHCCLLSLRANRGCPFSADGGPTGGIHEEARHLRAGYRSAKISQDRIPQRFVDRRRPQRAELLVEVPTVVSLSFLQEQSAAQNVEISVPGTLVVIMEVFKVSSQNRVPFLL